MSKFQAKVIEVGDSKAVVIPVGICRALDIELGNEVLINVKKKAK